MKKRMLYIVDVFAEEKYAGNQLAVFRHVEGLSDTDMQNIAREMHFSETTFILSDEAHDGGYDVRIFTPEQELPFAGHPTLGTAFVIRNEIVGGPTDEVILNLQVGQIPVTFEDADILWMKQNAPEFGEVQDAEILAAALSLTADDFDRRFPIQDVSTGYPCLIAPLKTLDALRRARVKKDEYFRFVENIRAKNILIFAPEPYKSDSHLSVRFFADFLGIPEDPATGSANGCLAGYLVKHRYWGGGKIDIRVDQGYEIKRPSLLFLRAEDKRDNIDVSVGGQVVMIAKGELM